MMSSNQAQVNAADSAFERTKEIYDEIRAMTSKQQPSQEAIRDCMKDIVAALKERGRQYYFFGGVSCQLLAKTPRATADVDVVIENSSMTLPNPHDWLTDEPFFWSAKYSQYVWAKIKEEVSGEMLHDSRVFVEVDINVAGWGSFPRFEEISHALVQLPGGCGLSLPRSELLKLKLAGWAEKSRREGPKKQNDIADIVALRLVMYMEGEMLDPDSLANNMKEGLRLWREELADDPDWRQIGMIL